MGWISVALVKNDLNEYRFAVIPNIENYYSGGTGGSNTTIRIGGLRNSNEETGSAAFQLGRSYVAAVAAQDGIFNIMDDPASGCNTYVYGSVGGEALRLLENTGSSTWFWNFNFAPHKLTNNMQSDVQLATYSANVLKDQSKNEDTVWTWGLVINHDTEQCYLMIIQSTLYWNYAIGIPNWYDSAEVLIIVCDSNLTDNNLYQIFKDSIPSGAGSNPYAGGGYSEPTEETGDFDETSDIIGEPILPASLAVSSGFLTVYNPTYTQVVDLGNYVWNSLPLDTFKKMFANPMDVIIGLSIFPFLIDDDSKNWEIMIGNINSHVTARKARNQFQVVDCGKLYIKPYSKSYLDYSPYTKIELALPYIGTKQLDTDIIMGKWIWVKYRVDLISGGCMAILSFSDTENGEYSVIAEYTGKCNIEIPISGSDFRELGRGILQAVAGTGAILLSNGAVGGDWVGSGLANLVTGMKPNIERSGGLTSCIGLLGVQKPRIIKTIPRQCVPENQAQLQGYPVLIKDNFANLEGFTSFEEVSIKGARMTEREKQRAKALLESGVIK